MAERERREGGLDQPWLGTSIGLSTGTVALGVHRRDAGELIVVRTSEESG